MEENPRLPYFTLVVPPEGDDEGDWQEVGALWKAKSGNGYSGSVKDGVEIVFEEAKKKPESKKKRVDEDDVGTRLDRIFQADEDD